MKKESKNKFVFAETMKVRRDKISILIDSAITDIETEINLHERGIAADATIPTLLQIKEELDKMKKALSPQEFVPTYNYIIKDSWNSFTKLGEKLLKIVHDYNEKLD